MFFKEELYRASALPTRVCAMEKPTRGGCPCLHIRATGSRVTALPARGYKKNGHQVHVYFNEWWSEEVYPGQSEYMGANTYLGTYHRSKLLELILKFGNMRPRNMGQALVDVGLMEQHASAKEQHA